MNDPVLRTITVNVMNGKESLGLIIWIHLIISLGPLLEIN